MDPPGGHVYLAGGTAAIAGGASGEAAYWNTFLNVFGLAFGNTYNGVSGNIAITSAHPIFNGVSALYQNNGNDTLDLALQNPENSVLVMSGGHGLYAIYESSPAVVSAPLPGAAFAGLGLFGLLGAVRMARRRR